MSFRRLKIISVLVYVIICDRTTGSFCYGPSPGLSNKQKFRISYYHRFPISIRLFSPHGCLIPVKKFFFCLKPNFVFSKLPVFVRFEPIAGLAVTTQNIIQV